MEQIRERLTSSSGRTLSFISLNGPKVGGRKGHKITVYFETKQDLEEASLPKELEGVQVETGVGFSVTPTSCYTESYDSVEAGAALNLESDSATFDNSWTSGGRMFNSNDSRRVLTVYHAVGSLCSPSDQTGTGIEQWGDYLGDVVDQYPDHDVILIDDPSSTKTIDHDVIKEDEDWELGGHYTKDGIKDGGELTQHAINTCESTTDIRAYDGTIECDNGSIAIDDVMLTDQVSKNHDSGALKVGLELASGEYWFAAGGIQSVNITTSDGSEYDGGAAAYAFTDSLSADFGPYTWS